MSARAPFTACPPFRRVVFKLVCCLIDALPVREGSRCCKSSDDEAVTDSQTAEQATDEQATETRTLRRRRPRRLLSRVSIQSKLVVMMVLCTIVAAAVVGFIALHAGRSSMRIQVFNRLTELRESQSRALNTEFTDLKNSLIIYSHGANTVPALQAFIAGFDQLPNSTASIPRNSSRSSTSTTMSSSRDQQSSTANTGCRRGIADQQRAALSAGQLHRAADSDGVAKQDDARDGSPWSAANARYNDFFREIVTRFRFEDALLIDTRGQRRLHRLQGRRPRHQHPDGPYKGSDCGDAYQQGVGSKTSTTSASPTSATTSPPTSPRPGSSRRSGPRGASTASGPAVPDLQDQQPDDDGRRWEESGMGATGETFIVGPDDLMRSNSRLFLEDPQALQARRRRRRALRPTSPRTRSGNTAPRWCSPSRPRPPSCAAGPARHADRRRLPGPRDAAGLCAAPTSPGCGGASSPRSTRPRRSPRSRRSPGSWCCRRRASSSSCASPRCCGPAVRAAHPTTRDRRPEISSGAYGTTIPVASRDEFGDLTVAFNDMSRNLAIKEDLLNEQRRENDRFMLSLMPEQVVARYREGEEHHRPGSPGRHGDLRRHRRPRRAVRRSELRRIAGDREQAGPPVRLARG